MAEQPAATAAGLAWPALPGLSAAERAAVAAERARVREFLAEAVGQGWFVPECDSWLGGFSAEFSRRLGARGWIGMTWPTRYGGRGCSQLVRQAVVEELLAAGAPVAAHWFADRQVGPALLRHGTLAQREQFLPAMARGELFTSIGMSEPDSGSDLASVRTRAVPDRDGWRVTGTKVWTSHAHQAHFLLALVRTAAPEPGGDRHAGLSQLLIDLHAPGVTVRPVRLLDGAHHFNEVVLQDVPVPGERVLGEVGAGWSQVMTELAYERSGPERYLSTFPLLRELARQLPPDPAATGALGRIYSRLWVLRQMSTVIARSIDAGEPPSVAAALVKDLGTQLEQDVIAQALRWRPGEPDPDSTDRYDRLLAQAQLRAPGYTLRGGTSEVLRGLVARELGMR